ncbi:MAG: rhomboid family intramembrane serine protease [Dehalococcoidales bacterium]
MPLSDRDYMKPSPPPRRRVVMGGGSGGILQNPVYIIIVLNLIVYLAAFVNSDKLVNTFGLAPSLFTQHPWTILTAMFVHVDFWHIFGNMLTLFFFGQAVYYRIGMKWFLLVYFVGGIAGNLLYVWLGAPYSIAIGASGAIYALAGALVVMIPKQQVKLYFIIPMPLWAFVLIFLVLWSIPNFIPGIAWQGHLGGFVVGLAAGFFFRRRARFVYLR